VEYRLDDAPHGQGLVLVEAQVLGHQGRPQRQDRSSVHLDDHQGDRDRASCAAPEPRSACRLRAAVRPADFPLQRRFRPGTTSGKSHAGASLHGLRRSAPHLREYSYTGAPACGWWDVPVPTYLSGRRAEYERMRAQERLG
jgi:hypothetical protein